MLSDYLYLSYGVRSEGRSGYLTPAGRSGGLDGSRMWDREALLCFSLGRILSNQLGCFFGEWASVWVPGWCCGE